MYVIAHKTRGYCIGPGGWDSIAEAMAWFLGKYGKTIGDGFAVVWVRI